MIAVRIIIVRFVDEEPQPGIVECRLVDAHGRSWIFLEKTAIVADGRLDARSAYPRSGALAVEVLGRDRDAVTGREIVRVDTARPWAIESVEGQTRFEVSPESLVDLPDGPSGPERS